MISDINMRANGYNLRITRSLYPLPEKNAHKSYQEILNSVPPLCQGNKKHPWANYRWRCEQKNTQSKSIYSIIPSIWKQTPWLYSDFYHQHPGTYMDICMFYT